jgi:hypothetical protein
LQTHLQQSRGKTDEYFMACINRGKCRLLLA